MPVKGEVKYVPMQSIHYDFGSKSMSGYFVDQAADCVVTLMVYEKGDPDAAPPTTATRVRLALNPGQMAGLDSEEGRSLNFTCGGGATALVVDSGERERLVETSKTELAKGCQPIVEDLTFRARRSRRRKAPRPAVWRWQQGLRRGECRASRPRGYWPDAG